MLSRKIIVFGKQPENAAHLFKFCHGVYFFNPKNREFLKADSAIPDNKNLVDLVALLESIYVEKHVSYEIIDDTAGEMLDAMPLSHHDITPEIIELVAEIRHHRYRIKKNSTALKMAVGTYYLMIDQSTASVDVATTDCSILVGSCKEHQLKLNVLYDRLHAWFDPLCNRKKNYGL